MARFRVYRVEIWHDVIWSVKPLKNHLGVVIWTPCKDVRSQGADPHLVSCLLATPPDMNTIRLRLSGHLSTIPKLQFILLWHYVNGQVRGCSKGLDTYFWAVFHFRDNILWVCLSKLLVGVLQRVFGCASFLIFSAEAIEANEVSAAGHPFPDW